MQVSSYSVNRAHTQTYNHARDRCVYACVRVCVCVCGGGGGGGWDQPRIMIIIVFTLHSLKGFCFVFVKVVLVSIMFGENRKCLNL